MLSTILLVLDFIFRQTKSNTLSQNRVCLEHSIEPSNNISHTSYRSTRQNEWFSDYAKDINKRRKTKNGYVDLRVGRAGGVHKCLWAQARPLHRHSPRPSKQVHRRMWLMRKFGAWWRPLAVSYTWAGRGGYSLVVSLRIIILDVAKTSKRSTVPAPRGDTFNNMGVHSVVFIHYGGQEGGLYSIRERYSISCVAVDV